MTASSEFVSRADRGAASADTMGSGPDAVRRRGLEVAAWLLGAAGLFACYLRLADTRAVNSDGAGQALQAWDMLHGNLLLHGWALSDVSFYTTELPQYMLVELIRGLNTSVVHVAAAMTYTLVVVLAALLAKGHATGRAAVARVLVTAGIMLAPQLALGTNVLISSPDHIGTTVPVLVVWLILDRARARWYVPVLTALLLGWAVVADTLVFYIGVLPLALVCAIRVSRALAAEQRSLKSQWYPVSLGGGAVLGGVAGEVALSLIEAHGFSMFSPAVRLLPSISQLPHSLNVAAQGLLLLGGADFLGQPVGAGTAVLALHFAGVLLAGCAVAYTVLRFLRDCDLVDQVLVSAVVINLGAYVVSTQSSSTAFTREIAAVLPFAAVLAGRRLAELLVSVRLAPVLLVVLLGYLAGFGYELVQPSAPAQNQQLASWLTDHHLRSGLSGYWESNVVTLASGDTVRVRPVVVHRSGLTRKRLESDAAWYDPRQQSANFVVLYNPPPFRGPYYPGSPTDYPGFTDSSAVLAKFGPPARVYRTGRYEILVWNKNLLAELR